ncbi:metallophosphoesterase [Endozoicomonas sp. OPT23]|uniref:purple acid phosphatase family protein n=1 Tax=Endozoicomonas sp. OPT23 TaxID=2072845 RepID=UPI00129B3BB0|nr:metallophosphoesterase family protein [Endozoicomonas sp. OPT23]MRI31412.1 metallophosphoesterase [Endozoicomonas sp. OPT23]
MLHKTFSVLLVCSAALLTSNASAHFEQEELTQIEIKTYQPTPVPDRIILTLSGDPATERSVNWRTDNNTETALAQIAKSSGSPYIEQDSKTIKGITSSLKTQHYTSYHHSVRFQGLEPATNYVYRVGDGQVWSEWIQFKTSKADNSPFSFIYFGDAQNDLKSRWSRVIRQAYSDMPKADFILHVGDLVNDALDDQEWGQWFYSAGWINGSIPSIATPGNHEYEDGDLSPQWNTHFTFPGNGPDNSKLKNSVYYIDYQGTRFISLNTQSMSEDPIVKTMQQKLWLEKVLKNNPNRWTIIFQHHPMSSAKEGRTASIPLNLMFKSIYEEYSVDLVLQGHDHAYARGNNLSTGGRFFDRQGPVYAVSVSGPKMYDAGAEWADVTEQNNQLYQLIDVSEKEIRYRAFHADGLMFDSFVITKDEQGKRAVK